VNWVKGDFVRPEIRGAKPQKLVLGMEEGVDQAKAMKTLLSRGVVHHKARHRQKQQSHHHQKQHQEHATGIKASYHADHVGGGYVI
jgi:hypothetical protein